MVPAVTSGSEIALAGSALRAKRRLIVLLVAAFTAIAYFSPFLMRGSNAYINIHDTLDGEFVNNYLLATTSGLPQGGIIPNVMNGLPATALPSRFNVTILLFYVFPPAWAYIVNLVLVHLIALAGMFLLLRKHFLTEDDDYLLAGAVSICFFLVPYYTTYGLSVAGQPLLAYAFLNIRGGERKWRDYLIVVLFPLWSVIALTLPFILTMLLAIFVVDWVRTRRFDSQFLLATLLLVCAYIALQSKLIHSVLGANAWVSHRSVWNRWTDLDLHSNIKRSVQTLFTTQYHTGAFWTLPIIISAALAFGLLLASKRCSGVLVFLASAIALICIEFGFFDWLVRWFEWMTPRLHAFNGTRFYFLLPLLWMLLLAVSVQELRRKKWGLIAGWTLIMIQAFALLKFNTEYLNNVRLLAGHKVYEPSFNRFFAQDLFTQMDQYIGKPKQSYRVVSFGMFPSVAQFNGFYTLDSYQNNYPLSYKLEFRKIIAQELDKDAILKWSFDGWGNRCYIFSSELGRNAMCSAGSHTVVHHLQLDMRQLRAMGGRYVISAVLIENSAENGLKLEKEFYSPDSFWHIYLYSLADEEGRQTAPTESRIQ